MTALNAKQALSAPQGPKRWTVRRVNDPANLFLIEGDSNGRLRVQRICGALKLVGDRTPVNW